MQKSPIELSGTEFKEQLDGKQVKIRCSLYPEFGFNLVVDGIGEIRVSLDSFHDSEWMRFHLTPFTQRDEIEKGKERNETRM